MDQIIPREPLIKISVFIPSSSIPYYIGFQQVYIDEYGWHINYPRVCPLRSMTEVKEVGIGTKNVSVWETLALIINSTYTLWSVNNFIETVDFYQPFCMFRQTPSMIKGRHAYYKR